MFYLLFSLSTVACIQAVCLACAAWFFIKREQVWQERQNALIDRLLKQGHIAPITIEREQVVKLPDPETPTETWIDQAMFDDEIKEELEQFYPEVARMSHSEAKGRYMVDWQRMRDRLRAERAPLRVE